MREHILSIDQGTTGSRAFIFNSRGRVVSSVYREFKQYYPKPGWVEHDPQEIWESVDAVVRIAVAQSRIDPKTIAAIGITNQRETTMMWDRKSGKPFHRAIVWQCRRTAPLCMRLSKHEALFRRQTGLVVDAYFSGTKIQWLLDHVPALRRKAAGGQVAFGTVDTWLIHQLTGGASHVTDMTNASRTLVYNIRTKTWSNDLLKLLNIPDHILPQVLPSASVFGSTVKGVAGLPAGIPISAVMGDQQAALYGQGCFLPGTIKNTYGTGCFLLLNTGSECVYSKNGLLTTLGCDAQGAAVYVLEGSVFIAGAIIQWLRDELKIIHDSSSTEKMIEGLEDTHGVYLVPALAGLGAPYWKADAKGLITGLTRGANARHIVRAALESLAYQTKEVFDLMQQESGLHIKSLSVDGGASRNNFLMQFQADMLSIPVLRPSLVDSTVAGAAYLAGVSIGLWKPKDILKINKTERTFVPCMPRNLARSKYNGWCHAVRQTLAQ
ncbi:MAG: glycerol kinase GlpK [Candidatus Omnitrophica bacterium]|nr:glycerol kinase GlpK [Candidatus Omnitrophota bacterium]